MTLEKCRPIVPEFQGWQNRWCQGGALPSPSPMILTIIYSKTSLTTPPPPPIIEPSAGPKFTQAGPGQGTLSDLQTRPSGPRVKRWPKQDMNKYK